MRTGRGWWVLGLALGVPACGASFEAMHDADQSFEHCYRLDEEARVPVAEKRACWHAWNQGAPAGQARDRIAYGRAREAALGEAEASGRGGAPVPRGDVGPRAATMPTSAFVSPPRTAPPEGGAHGAAASADVPGARCGHACSDGWRSCGPACGSPACAAACDDRYRQCMRGCF